MANMYQFILPLQSAQKAQAPHCEAGQTWHCRNTCLYDIPSLASHKHISNGAHRRDEPEHVSACAEALTPAFET